MMGGVRLSIIRDSSHAPPENDRGAFSQSSRGLNLFRIVLGVYPTWAILLHGWVSFGMLL